MTAPQETGRPGTGDGGPGADTDGEPGGAHRRARSGFDRAALLPRPERPWRRRDVAGVAVIAVAALVFVTAIVAGGDGAHTTDRTASPPLATPDPAPVPTRLVEAWRAPSPSTLTPVLAGPAVVAAGTTPDGGGEVVGLDPATGARSWEYRRPQVPCTAGGAFGAVLAVFATDGPVGSWCSDVAAFTPATGERGPARNADVRPGTRLIADSDHVIATGRDYLEVWRSDLVATLEYGRLPTPVQGDPQPRAACLHGSIAAGGGNVAVLERCPGESSDRLSVLTDDPSSYDKPEDRYSVPTGVVGGRLVATTADRTAVAAPDGTLRLFDTAGRPIATVPLGPAAGPTTDPPGFTAGTRPAGPVLLWWTGTATVGLDPADLHPHWTLPGTLGPGTPAPTGADSGAPGAPTTLLVPVPAGFAVVDAGSGAVRATVPVDRAGSPPPPGGAGGAGLGVVAVGSAVVEQRGTTLVALRPPP